MRYYAGIGSRKTPKDVLFIMERIGQSLASRFVLRSGGAGGADTSFERGANRGQGVTEIFLPWKGFNADDEDREFLPVSDLFLDNLPQKIQYEAAEIAKQFHRHWNELTIGGKKLHTRNVLQILGRDLNTPSEFVICWTKDGKATGGTGQAMRIAKSKGIPIYNLKNNDDRDSLVKWWNMEYGSDPIV
jgi:hypothetical protein